MWYKHCIEVDQNQTTVPWDFRHAVLLYLIHCVDCKINVNEELTFKELIHSKYKKHIFWLAPFLTTWIVSFICPNFEISVLERSAAIPIQWKWIKHCLYCLKLWKLIFKKLWIFVSYQKQHLKNWKMKPQISSWINTTNKRENMFFVIWVKQHEDFLLSLV